MKVKLQIFYHILSYMSEAGSGFFKSINMLYDIGPLFLPALRLSLGKAFPFQVLWGGEIM